MPTLTSCVQPVVVVFYDFRDSLDIEYDRPHIAIFEKYEIFSCFIEKVAGDIGKMGKVVASAPKLRTPTLDGPFAADLNAYSSSTPTGLNSPFYVAKKVIR